MQRRTPDRHHRQTLLPDVGEAGQARLRASHACVVGCGALGCAAADLLARAGVGRLTLIDRDLVEETNLQRQTLFATADVGEPKAAAAAARVRAIDPGVGCEPVIADLTGANAEGLVFAGGASASVPPPSVVVDGTDNFETRFVLNDLAVKRGVPLVCAGAVATRGTALTVLPGETPCLRCLFAGPPPAGTEPTCDTAGVLGPLVAMAGAIEATEAIKVLLGRPDLVRRTLAEFDPWAGVFREVNTRAARDAACVCCGQRRFEFLDAPAAPPAALCGRDAVQVMPAAVVGEPARLDLSALAARLGPHGAFEATRFMVRGVLAGEAGRGGEPLRLSVFGDGRAIVEGTDDPARARAVYAKYIGA